MEGMRGRGLLEVGNRVEFLGWRRALWEAGFESEGYRAALMRACREDILFWANSFCCLLEPRPMGGSARDVKTVILQTFPFQEEHILWIQEHVEEQRDGLTEKSRDMSATWDHLIVMQHIWTFYPDCMMLVMSAKEEMVDSIGNERALFQKMDYLYNRLPGWMRPPRERRLRHMRNLATGSVINGEATTVNTAVGDRGLWMLLDEFGKVDLRMPGLGEKIRTVTADAYNCRMANSTPEGMDSGFFGMRQTLSAEDIFTLHWSQHPLKNKGLYRVEDDGRITTLDKGYDFSGYEFVREIPKIMEGVVPVPRGLRSPWYDAECLRRGSKRAVAKELDINYTGAGDPVFDQGQVTLVRNRLERAPDVVGPASLVLPEIPKDLDRTVDPMRLWMNFAVQMKPPQDTVYVVAADISTGTGVSDTCFSLWDAWGREKVGEYQSNQILPEDAALMFVEFLKWLTTPKGLAFGIWDKGGPGLAFGKRIVQKWRYLNIYYSRDEEKRSPISLSDKPGYPLSSAQAIQNLLEPYRISLFNGECVVRSKVSYDQALQYVYVTGGIAHQKSRLAESESGKGKQHGDMVIADALGEFACQFQAEPVTAEVKIDPESYAAKEQKALDRAESIDAPRRWWD